ncbi:MAG: NeuD/PglB/VioB family sugar acetyltransferase [Anaerolineaceae bacterium]|nr:NeuD/PglB/VioB family sugar acetyltransferase [Anaerolineaceae bacterium]
MTDKKYPQFDFDPTKVIIYGGGGLSKMIIETVRAMSTYQIIGVIDDNMTKGTDVIGAPVIGGADLLPQLMKDGIRLAVNSVGGIGNYKIRLDVFHTLAREGFVCPVIIHPSAYVDPSARLESGVLVLAQSYVSGNAVIGIGTLINNSVVVSHDCVLGVCTNLSPGAKIAGDVTIDDFAQLGMNATVNIGVKVGKECLVGNGATVKKDVPPGTRVYAGTIWPKYDPNKNKTAE